MKRKEEIIFFRCLLNSVEFEPSRPNLLGFLLLLPPFALQQTNDFIQRFPNIVFPVEIPP